MNERNKKTIVKEEINFDAAVIGAGPAGMIAAGRAAELGAKIILVEKNRNVGKKLVLTGKGRCNITNAEFNLRKLVENYSRNGKFLFHAFSVFGPRKVIDFFEKLGLKTKIERGKRVFPISDRSKDVLSALLKYLAKNKVKIICNSEVKKIISKNQKIQKLILNKGEIKAKNYIFCTGGKSYALTGSTGDGFKWAAELGHNIKKLSPALVPIRTKEKWVKELQGLSLKNVEIKVFQADKKEFSKFGECLFTHFGLSGPIILDMSKRIGELLKKGEVNPVKCRKVATLLNSAEGNLTGLFNRVKLFVDLKPALDCVKLDKRVQRDFKKYQNKLFKNCLADLLPRKLIPVIVKLSNINPEKKVNNITKKERQQLVKLLKNLELTAKGLLGFDSAIVTSGGISLKEIDDKTMKSKIIDNLFFAGEIIDIDGPSGGFNLQNCWSTGYLAGENIVK